jgi:hypothetical protein
MAGRADRETLKREALLSLEQSRGSLHTGVAAVREQLSPKALIQHSLEKHRTAIMVSAAVAGFLAVRLVLPGKQNRRDTSVKSATKRSLSSFLLSGIWGMAREPLLGLAAQQLLPVVMQYVSHFQTPPQPRKPE